MATNTFSQNVPNPNFLDLTKDDGSFERVFGKVYKNQGQGAKSGVPSLHIAVELIDSSRAKQLLSANAHNRPLSKRNLAKITHAMRAGHWKFTADPIRLADDGTLLDGQHRLTSVIQVDTALPFVVVRGLSKDVFDCIDTNQPRTAADVFAVNGEEDAPSLVAALRFVDLASNDYITTRFSNIQMELMLDQHPGIRDSIAYIKQFKHQALKIPARVLHGYHYLFAAKHAPLADEFIRKLLTGENVSADEPVYLLRNALIANAARRRSVGLTAKHIAAIACKAWNFTRRGQKISVLKWGGESINSLKPEKFPIVK